MHSLLLLVALVFDDGFFVVSPVVLPPKPLPTPTPVAPKWVVTEPVKKAAVKPKTVVVVRSGVRNGLPLAVAGMPIRRMYPAPRATTLAHLRDPNDAHAYQIPKDANLESMSPSDLTRLHDLLHAGYRVSWRKVKTCHGSYCTYSSVPVLY